MQPPAPGMPYPDAAEFAAHVASLYGLRRIVDAGGSWNAGMAIAYPGLKPLNLRDRAWQREPWAAAVLAAGAASEIQAILDSHAQAIGASPLLTIATDDPAATLAWLAERHLEPTFAGRTRTNDSDSGRSGHLIVVDRALARTLGDAGKPPESFRVVAIMAAYNEEDVIGPAIEKLVGDGVGVYLIDNWSTDRTHEIARSFEGRGLVGIEKFPAAADDHFVLRALVHRTAEVASGLDAAWCIHHDADERRRGPWPEMGLRDSLWLVDRAGFNAVDFTVANYRPIDESFRPGSDFEKHFRHFEFGDTSDLLLQIKGWKNLGRVDLASSAGHQARFKARRIFPYKFLLKHYPIRSQAHGERKIFQERVPRWDRHERLRGWHIHYDSYRPEQSFLADPATLIEDRGAQTWSAYMPEALAGAGLIHRTYPAWALASPFRGRVFLGKQAIERSSVAAACRNVIGKSRGLARRLRRLRHVRAARP